MYDKLTDPLTDITTLTEALLSGAFGAMGGDQREGLKDVHASAWGLYTLFMDIITNVGLENIALQGYLRDKFIGLMDPLIDRSQSLLNGTDGPLSEEQEISLEYIQEVSLLLRKHTDALWLYSQLMHKQLDVRHEAFTLSDALDDLILPSIVLEIEYELVLADSQARVVGDVAYLLQAIEALINNAVQFLGDGREIALYSNIQPGGWLRVRVMDDGIGIAPEQHNRIFEPFYQIVNRTENLGLGLTIVKGLIEGQGGKLELQSDSDAGSTFGLLLPLATQGT